MNSTEVSIQDTSQENQGEIELFFLSEGNLRKKIRKHLHSFTLTDA